MSRTYLLCSLISEALSLSVLTEVKNTRFKKSFFSFIHPSHHHHLAKRGEARLALAEGDPSFLSG
jgi:hypothetical protein